MMRQFLFSCTLFALTAVLSSFAFLAAEEIGKAGYYADSLHGRKTASGELYDKNEYTCAHKNLPFGTKVRVTRLDNKKSVVVRVNDRGPFVDGYVVDISRKAAEDIGLIRDGVTRVKVEVVEAASNARVAAETDGNAKVLIARENAKSATVVAKGVKPATYNAAPATAAAAKGKSDTELYQIELQQFQKAGYGVQVTTLYDADNVLPILKKLQRQWPGKSLVLMDKNEVGNSVTYKVIIGPYGDKKSAEAQQKVAAKKGYRGCFVVDISAM